VIAIDTNILVYAHREDSPWHAGAYSKLEEVATGRSAWAIPWPCLYEFLAIVTHPRIYDPPTPLDLAVDQVDAWLESPGLILLGEGEQHWPLVRSVVVGGKIAGPQMHDARITALCLSHGVRELWTADRDFNRFPQLTTLNPLV